MGNKILKGERFPDIDIAGFRNFIRYWFGINQHPNVEYLLTSLNKSSKRFKKQIIIISTPRGTGCFPFKELKDEIK